MELFSSWTGSDFLSFYIMLLGASTLAAWWIPAHLRAEGRRGDSPDAESIALLARGRAGYTDSVIADLYARGGVKHYADGKLHIEQPDLPANPAGRTLLAARQPLTPSVADKLLAVHADRVAARLRREGLMLRSEELGRLRWLSTAPFIALFLLGIYRHRAGSAIGEPTGYLTVLLAVTVMLAVIRFLKCDPRTLSGIEAVQRLRQQSGRLRRAPRAEEAALAVALFGTGVLVGTPWQPVHAMRQQQGSGDSGGSSGGSDSGGGDGGGGCGGCGG
ncbi:MAG: TIGR04222 domain-containing membrane protein [Erythrobacter sp.]|jgi:uncharacterized protein (TIGR04222 family)|nr:TIGR04222 domain-containing membrane protein [Erythrobacter sp.]